MKWAQTGVVVQARRFFSAVLCLVYICTWTVFRLFTIVSVRWSVVDIFTVDSMFTRVGDSSYIFSDRSKNIFYVSVTYFDFQGGERFHVRYVQCLNSWIIIFMHNISASYNVCLENGSDQLFVYRWIDRLCL